MVPEEIEGQHPTGLHVAPLPPYVASDHGFVLRTSATEIRVAGSDFLAVENLAERVIDAHVRSIEAQARSIDAQVCSITALIHLINAQAKHQSEKIMWCGIRSLLMPTIFGGVVTILLTTRAGRLAIAWLTGRS